MKGTVLFYHKRRMSEEPCGRTAGYLNARKFFHYMRSLFVSKDTFVYRPAFICKNTN